MEQDLVKILRELREIKPDADYTRRSRLLIVSDGEIGSLPKYGFFDILKTISFNRMALVAEITVALVLFILGGVYYIHQSNQNLVVQANELNATIQLKLDEITSYLKNQPGVDPSRIGEVNLLLEKVNADLNQASVDLKDGKLEDSLKKMKSAQEVFSQVESVIKQ